MFFRCFEIIRIHIRNIIVHQINILHQRIFINAWIDNFVCNLKRTSAINVRNGFPPRLKFKKKKNKQIKTKQNAFLCRTINMDTNGWRL